jgi:hypothetical protein
MNATSFSLCPSEALVRADPCTFLKIRLGHWLGGIRLDGGRFGMNRRRGAATIAAASVVTVADARGQAASRGRGHKSKSCQNRE